MKRKALQQLLLERVGSLIRIKGQIFWHLTNLSEINPDRFGIILPNDVRFIETASLVDSKGANRASATVLLDGRPVRIFLSLRDIDFV